MRSSDYRVGNIIDPSSPRRIDGEDIYLMDKRTRHCPPVEMSKEWAERTEMQYLTSADHSYYNIDLCNGCSVYFNDCGGRFHGGVVIDFEDERGEAIEDIDVISEIKYVHELQNIYFVFTGKELIFKE